MFDEEYKLWNFSLCNSHPPLSKYMNAYTVGKERKKGRHTEKII
jgi:hypothetical protein